MKIIQIVLNETKKKLEVKSSNCPMVTAKRRHVPGTYGKKSERNNKVIHVVFPWLKSGLDKLH